MSSNVAAFLLAVNIISTYSLEDQFFIENKRTGKVIQDVGDGHQVVDWDNTDSQMWVLKPKDNLGYSIVNVGNGKNIGCTSNFFRHSVWNLNISGNTRIETAQPGYVLRQQGNGLKCSKVKHEDDSDKWLFVEQFKKINMKFVIENTQTEMVLEENKDDGYRWRKWQDKDSQLWTLKPRNGSGYSIINVESRRPLEYYRGDIKEQIWRLRDDTKIHFGDINVSLTGNDDNPVYLKNEDNDGSNSWLLVKYESKKAKVKPIPIQSEDYKQKFAIKNKKTGMVVELVITGDKTYKMVKGWNTDSQSFSLEPRNNSKYSIISSANGKDVGCTINGTRYHIWKLNIHGYTRIEIEDPPIFLAQDHTNGFQCFNYKHDDDSDMWLFVEPSKNDTMFVIKNKDTGMALEHVMDTLKLGKWQNRDSQLWILKSQNKSIYSIVNIATRGILTYSKDGTDYQTWKLTSHNDTWIHIENPDVYLVQEGNKAVYTEYKRIDEDSRWLLLEYKEQQPTEIEMKSEPIYVERHRDKFVIENKKSGMVLDVPEKFLRMNDWEDIDSQLWTLELQDKHFIIRNVANRGVLTYLQNGTDHQLWNLTTIGDTYIQVKDINIFLADTDGETGFIENKQSDESDKWLLIKEELKRSNTKPIYVETQVIEIA